MDGEATTVGSRFGNVVLRGAQKLGCYAVDLGIGTLESEILNSIGSLGVNFTGTSFAPAEKLWNVGVAEIAEASSLSEIAGEYALTNTATRRVVALYLNPRLDPEGRVIGELVKRVKDVVGKDVKVVIGRVLHVERKLIAEAGGDFMLSIASRVKFCPKCVSALAEYYQRFGLSFLPCS